MEWVQQLGLMRGHKVAYELRVVTFQVKKCILTWVLMKRIAKDMEPIRAWKDHNDDFPPMHYTVDVIELATLP